jgi:transcriptional regulator NrdR family protein
MALDDTDNIDPRRHFANCLPLNDYTRRRRVCNACGHRFTTIEIRQEDITAVALEVESLRKQVEQHKSAMQLMLNSLRS